MGSPTDIDVEKLKIEYEKLKEDNLRLQKEVDGLKRQVSVIEKYSLNKNFQIAWKLEGWWSIKVYYILF